jgi:hypothetical protein
MAVRLLIGSDVVAALGGPQATRAALARVTSSTFTCTRCHRRGVFAEEPAAVVVRMTVLAGSRRERPVVGFAHPGCSGSRVEQRGVPASGVHPAMHAIGWVDDTGGQPRAVILIGPVATETATTASGDRIDLLMAALHSDGFTSVPDLVTPLPQMPGLVADQSADTLVVRVPTGHHLYHGPPVGDPNWATVAADQRRVTVLVASGMRLDDPGRDPMADLFTAMGRSLVAGATATYTGEGVGASMY